MQSDFKSDCDSIGASWHYYQGLQADKLLYLHLHLQCTETSFFNSILPPLSGQHYQDEQAAVHGDPPDQR